MNTDSEVLLTHAQAAQYLDRHIQMLNEYVRSGKLVPDGRMFAGQRLYLRSTLDEFKRKWMNEDGLTLHEVAERYGKNYHDVYYHFRRKRRIEGVAKYLKQVVYSETSVRMVASEEGWRIK